MKKKRWYWRPVGYCGGIGPIEAPNYRAARAWFRWWAKVDRLYGEVWQE
jgi:hypothetical protein